ncbi:hypothetical protein LINGRAHAP2_LOCUS8704 [Linum grandiflorum]
MILRYPYIFCMICMRFLNFVRL